jgi:hypothetical protein
LCTVPVLPPQVKPGTHTFAAVPACLPPSNTDARIGKSAAAVSGVIACCGSGATVTSTEPSAWITRSTMRGARYTPPLPTAASPAAICRGVTVMP